MAALEETINNDDNSKHNKMIDNNLLATIKNVSLPQILADFGIRPKSERSLNHTYYMYLATYRGEHNPSISVFRKKDGMQWLYRDHTTGEVGTNLDLLVRFGCFRDWREAASYIAEKYLGINIGRASTNHPKSPIIQPLQINQPTSQGLIHRIKTIVRSPAEQYIVSVRRIPIEVAALYVSYAYYSYPPSERTLSGIAWPTCRGGWSIRWPIDLGKGKGKGFVGPGGISFFPRMHGSHSTDCAVFEGIFDFLTFVRLHGHKCDSIVLNSVDNIQESLGKLNSYRELYGYLDNDTPGRKCWDTIVSHYGTRAIDASPEFSGYKDYNDFLKAQNII